MIKLIVFVLDLRHLKLRIKYSHVDSREIARETLLNMSLFGEIPYLYLKISGTYISGGKPRSVFLIRNIIMALILFTIVKLNCVL